MNLKYLGIYIYIYLYIYIPGQLIRQLISYAALMDVYIDGSRCIGRRQRKYREERGGM